MSTYTEKTKAELYAEAQERDLEGRSNWTKPELAEVLDLDDRATDAVDLVLAQHEQIRSLFAGFAGCEPGPSRRKDDLVDEMVTILVKHARMEELVLYPAAREHLPELADEIDEGIEEHHLADRLLDEIQSMDSDDERFDEKVHVMIEAMEHHLDEEENDLLGDIRRGLDDRQRLELGAAMEQAWKAAPTRPHPNAPQTPPGNVVAAAAATIVDAGRDLVDLLRRRR